MVAVVVTGCAGDAGDHAGTLFVTDRGGDAVIRFDAATGALVDVFAEGEVDQIDRPSSVRVTDEHLYLANFGRGQVLRYWLDTGELEGVFYADTAYLEEPVELQFLGTDLYVLGNDTRNTVVIDEGGQLVTSFGYPQMRAAHDIAFGPDGNLYVATEWNPQLESAIQVWDIAAGELMRTFGPASELSNATGLAFAGDGSLYVTDETTGRLVHYDPLAGALLDIAIDSGGGLAGPRSCELAADGSLFIADASGIVRFDPRAGAAELLIPVGDQLVSPRSVTIAR